MSNFKQLYDKYDKTFRKQLLDKLYELSPYEFEHFAQKLLDAYGFVDVEVTQASKDGGIDGYGNLKLGLATMKAAFQCKRWQGNVPKKEVDSFRGVIQGEYEQGIFFTTSDYAKGAKDASLKRGAVPIILLNGDSIVDLMIEKELGVERVPLYIYRERVGDFMTDEEEIPIHPPVVVTTPEIDTIVVPVREEGFQKAFIGGNCWYAIRISKKMIPKIKYIAAYQVAPVSAITHIAFVKSVEQWQDSNKYIVHFAEPAREINPIKLVSKGKGKAPQAPRYTSMEKLENAKTLAEAF